MLSLFGLGLVAVVLRLGQLQIVQANYYRARADRSMLARPVRLPFVRGRVLDRTGEVLVRDEPCWNLTVDYEVLAADLGGEKGEPAMDRLVKRFRRARRYEVELASGEKRAPSDAEVEKALLDELARMWADLALFTADKRPTSITELQERGRTVFDRVLRIRRAVKQRRGFDAPVAEEKTSHWIVPGLDPKERVNAVYRFSDYPWVHVEPSSLRHVVGDGEPLAHVLGRLGRVDASDVADDPNADDPFARYRADERVGISGVEFAAEQVLRGRRGQISNDLQGRVIEGGYIEAENGTDARLTIHAGLQRRLYRVLGEVVESHPDSSGGAIVVLDVASRGALALVSYPSYDPSRFDELYSELRRDTDRLPLRFRAVANRYAPGSTVKPLTCLVGLMNGIITLDTHEHCSGYLFPENPKAWRCWQIHGTTQRKAHGSIDVVAALTGSCNVFMYRLGEKITVDGLCSAFRMVGVGEPSGMGLLEESWGINPTPSWLMAEKNLRPTAGTARNFAIGQAEVSMTPVQVANLMATYASGRYRPVTLVRGGQESPEWALPATEEQWLAIRRGIYGVVNNPEGTAYRHARFQHERYALCGKTGSATAHRWPTSYRIPYMDEAGAESVAFIRAGARKQAIEEFRARYPGAAFDPKQATVATKWPPRPPPPDDKYSHAWFGGYLQEIDGVGRPIWSKEPPIAFAVLIEFGGSGGRTSGPLARQVARELLDVFGPELNPDQDLVARASP